jgi:hypothetical protein
VAIWRYDPIILSSLTPIAWHRDNVANLARRLEGTTYEVVVSLAQIYQKTQHNMNAAAREHGFSWDEHPDPKETDHPGTERRRQLLLDLAGIARAHGMQLTVCS